MWRDLVHAWDFDQATTIVLRAACEAFDRAQQARRILAREGIVVRDRKGRRMAHPAVIIERDARLALLRSWRLLGLDLEPPGAIGRPPGS